MLCKVRCRFYRNGFTSETTVYSLIKTELLYLVFTLNAALTLPSSITENSGVPNVPIVSL